MKDEEVRRCYWRIVEGDEEDRSHLHHQGDTLVVDREATPLVEVNDVTVGYGDLEVVFDLSLKVHAGEIVVSGRS
ncbi:MAG: hypothetical protein ACOXZ4_07535 [Sphaerochaetaceae bacterium]